MGKTLNEKIGEIRNDFIQSLPLRAEKLQNLAAQLVSEVWDPGIAKALMYEVHNLRGFSGSHGLMIIHELSATAEDMVESLRAKNGNLSTDEKATLQAAVNALVERMHYIHDHFQYTEVRESTEEVSDNSKSPLILIVDDDKNFCDVIAIQLEHLGYRTKYVYDIEDIETSINTFKPQAIFMDIVFNGERDAGIEIVNKLRSKDEITCPLIYMSAREDLVARLQAVRSGGIAFLNKNFNLADLHNLLEVYVPLQQNTSFKVLIIDDDPTSAEYCTAILQHAGIQVSVLDKPEHVFTQLMQIDPDVILLDMYMPDIDGFEMASIIRQHQNFSALPIVIMSGETDINKQFKMRCAGADDFILKPFKPHHLVDTILNRIHRSRQTKRLIYTDGLTNLMLYAKVKDQINNLLDSCIRYNLEFSVAIIDLDHFKRINDTYGHLIGDQILRDFGEFLLTRVRKSDIVTRSGGEEFAIFFPYTSTSNALRAVNSIRYAFSKCIQHAGDEEFIVTFSAGIASINLYQDLESLLSAADQALYRAKETGRNHIETAT